MVVLIGATSTIFSPSRALTIVAPTAISQVLAAGRERGQLLVVSSCVHRI
jgi:hypothetical protein